MKLGELAFGSNVKIPERREDGTYELTDYTLGCLNNFDVGTAGLIRKDIHSLCRFGDSAEYAGSDLDNRMTKIYDSYPDELKEMIIPCTFSLYNGGDTGSITRKVFVPTLTMVGCGDNHVVEEGLTWSIFTLRNSRKKTFNGTEAAWWLSSRGFLGGTWRVNMDGTVCCDDPSFTYGVVPAFIIPQSVQVDDTPDNDGSYRLTVLESYCS